MTTINTAQQLQAQYPWAVNAEKLERAFNEAKASGKVTDEAVKAIYVRLAGKVQEVETAEEVATGFDALTVKELREIAETNGIDHDGLKKAELIAALTDAGIEAPAVE